MGHHHGHSHGHHHGHSHTVSSSNLNRAFIIGIVLNLAFVLVEGIAGWWTHSLALLTDAGHNLSDVASLALSLLAFRLAKVKANDSFTYGYSKSTVIVALANAIILLIAIGGIGVEAVQRFFHPEPMSGGIMAIVAGIGILVNASSAFLFFRDKDHDLNVKGAYLHLAADALVSLGVVVTGIIIIYTGLYWLDSVVSIIIMIVILISTWSLLSDSLRLSMDAVPRSIDMEKLRSSIKNIKGIQDIHHIHVWAISTTVNAMTAHLVVDENLASTEEQQLKENVRHELHHLNIQHVTLETERGEGKCEENECTPSH